MDEVNDQINKEVRVAIQVALQISRFFSEVRRRQLERARNQSMAQEQRIRRMIDHQRRLADPVLRRGLDDRFWEAAQPTDAAYVYGVATRFQDIDPLAAQAAQRCREEVSKRWNMDLDAPRGPVMPGQVDQQTLAAVAPVVAGEESRDLDQDLVDSAGHASQQTAEGPDKTAAPGQSTEQEAGRADLGPFEAERAEALEWLRAHYEPQELPFYVAPNPYETKPQPQISESRLADYAQVLRSAMAAEGLDVDNPPRLGLGDHEVDFEFNANVGVGDMLAEIVGADPYDWSTKVDHRALRPMRQEWAAEQHGRYPDIDDWHFNVLNKGSQAIDGVPAARAADEAPAPGHYDELARRAASFEAERAGMDVDSYMDALTPLQRRAMILGNTWPNTGYEPEMARVAAWRIATAQATAAKYTARAQRTTPQAVQQQAAEREASQELTGEHLQARAQASWQDDRPHRNTTDEDLSRGHGDANSMAAPLAGTVAAVETAASLSTSDAAAALPALAPEVAWDSPQARQEWADGLLAKGHDPVVVRAAVAGDQALHEPAHRATAPSKAAPTEGRRPRTSATQARTNTQSL